MACQRSDPLDLEFARTTYEASYIDHKSKKNKVYRGPFEHVDNTRERTRKPYIMKSTETLCPFRQHLSIEFFMRPKRITRTHPHQPFDPNVSS